MTVAENVTYESRVKKVGGLKPKAEITGSFTWTNAACKLVLLITYLKNLDIKRNKNCLSSQKKSQMKFIIKRIFLDEG